MMVYAVYIYCQDRKYQDGKSQSTVHKLHNRPVQQFKNISNHCYFKLIITHYLLIHPFLTIVTLSVKWKFDSTSFIELLWRFNETEFGTMRRPLQCIIKDSCYFHHHHHCIIVTTLFQKNRQVNVLDHYVGLNSSLLYLHLCHGLFMCRIWFFPA